MKKIIFLLLVIPLLASCAPTSAPTAIAQIQSSSPYDGTWEGTGQTRDGNHFIVSFRVENGEVLGISYQYNGPKDVPCFNTHYFILPKEQRPQLDNNSFTTQLGADMNVSAQSTGTDSASGHPSADVDYRYTTCNGQFELNWTAKKQPPVVTVESQPAPKKINLKYSFKS
ncbi:MAG: hypothetical protein IPL71_14065 [Anaerolineales bacterium]|uniref:hypothetical protein n=1 Tax=Candidatus Villigracilis proximus TaxID=3140683 RepID=UPI0031365C89|nr:hypothetical protein [Anaerolineales bacterium]